MYEGLTNEGVLLGRWCGSLLPSSVISMSGDLYLHLHFRSEIEGEGFEAAFDVYNHGMVV